jgi:arabinan endo-1,5-alpha-L-arabinosidase
MNIRWRRLAPALLWPLLAALLAAAPAGATEPVELELSGSLRQARDPVVAEHDGRYYLFTTGNGIPIRTSDDLQHWQPSGLVFFGLPAWAREHVPGAQAIWAPDISFFGGRYHLYFSVSTFGSNTSAIGLATNPTLDPDDPDYAWTDHGIVIASEASDDWNAIDPNIVVTPEGEVWMAFGSFWSGIKMLRIDPATGMPSAADPKRDLLAIASRPLRPHAIEAPFIVHRHGAYYLFVSFDQCCRGVESDYNIRVGRADAVTGPYVDRDGTPMLEGGGTLVVAPSERWPGAGHNAVLHTGGRDLLVYHGYDASFGGSATLRIEVIDWDDEGWPVSVNGPERSELQGSICVACPPETSPPKTGAP